ncbi:MAG: PAS domain S-box protein, partial [Candidatus Hydrogenedentes bacterium]|nr:PAS domain S-box protein [Candidatus Hydrogenedentota bacterium]
MENRIVADGESWAYTLIVPGMLLAVVAVLGAFMFFFLRRYVLTPVHAIELALEARSRGEVDVYAQILAQDEIGHLALALNTMIEVQIESRVKHTQVLNTIQDGVVALDAGGIIQVANPSMESMLGYHEGALTGKNFLTLLFGGGAAHGGDGGWDTLGPTGSLKIGPASGEITVCHQDGSRFPAYMVVSEMAMSKGTGYTGVVRDIRIQ